MAPSHPPFDRLTNLVRGDLSTDQQAEIAAHVVTCPLCADEVAWLEHILELYRTDESVSAPPAAIRSVRDFFRSKVTPQGEESWRHITAELTFDSAHMPPAIDVRSDTAMKRQMVFRAAEFELDIHVASTRSGWIIFGQVLGSDEGGHAELQEPTGPLRVPLNELRQFTLSPVAAGTYTLIVWLKDTVIEIPRLEIVS
jgi:hypothetical protein